MASSLHPLFDAISRIQDERDLRTQVVPKLGEHFAAKRSGLFFFDSIATLSPNLQKIFKVALSIDRNPVVRYLAEHHAPVHEEVVTSPKVRSVICPRADHWHVMVGPIVNRGKLVGRWVARAISQCPPLTAKI